MYVYIKNPLKIIIASLLTSFTRHAGMMSPSRTNNINGINSGNNSANSINATNTPIIATPNPTGNVIAAAAHHRRSSRNSSTASTNTTLSGTGRRCGLPMSSSDMLQNKLRSLLNAPPDSMSDIMNKYTINDGHYDKYMSPKKLNQEVCIWSRFSSVAAFSIIPLIFFFFLVTII